MKTEKILKKLLCVLFSAALLCSCAPQKSDINDAENTENGGLYTQSGVETDKETDSNTENLPEKTDYFASLPDEDYGGREFVILTTDPAFTDSETESGIIGGALFRRNRAIEEKLGIKITVIPTDSASFQSALQNGETVPDLVYAPMEAISAAAGNGLIMNLYSVPFFDTSAEYADPGLVSDLTLCDTTYGIYGAGAHDKRSAYCVFYNKYLLSGIGYDIPALVKSGEWTWEKFLEISALAVADLDGNKRMRSADDRYGYASTSHTGTFCDAVFASIGKKFLSRDQEGFFKTDFAQTDEDRYIKLLRDICVTNKSKFPVENPGDAALDAFSEGRLAFFCEKLSYASLLAYSGCDWGIAPMPKLSASQSDYISICDGSVCGYAVAYGASDSALSGKVISAIYAYEFSRGENTVDSAWTHYYLRDNSSAVMLKNYFNNPAYDAAYAFGGAFADFRISTYELLRTVVRNNTDFDRLYNQNSAPFSAFVRNQFVN